MVGDHDQYLLPRSLLLCNWLVVDLTDSRRAALHRSAGIFIQAETTLHSNLPRYPRGVSKRPTMATSNQNQTIESLIRRSESARAELTGHIQTLQHRVNIPARLKESVRSRPSIWFGGSMIIGLLATKMLRRKPAPAPEKTKTRKGLLGLACTAAIALAKPAIKTLLIAELRKRFLPPASVAERSSRTHFSD